MPLCPPQTRPRSALGFNLGFCGERLAHCKLSALATRRTFLLLSERLITCCCVGKRLPFVISNARNKETHCVSKRQRYLMLQHTVHIVTTVFYGATIVFVKSPHLQKNSVPSATTPVIKCSESFKELTCKIAAVV
jgi:hypothetical protein